MNKDSVPARVRWRARRGLLELDLVFARFLDQEWASLEASQRAAFEELLGLADTILAASLLKNEGVPEGTSSAVAAIAERIRRST